MVQGPRACGKTTTASQRAETVVKLNAEAQAAAFVADPDVALRDLPEPVLLDEWQEVPVVFHTGPQVYGLGERIAAVPIAALWG
jgi:hypothetical protein